MKRSFTAFAVIALSIFVAAPLPLAGSTCGTLAEWGSRGAARSIAFAGNFATVADGRGLSVYDLSNPDAIRRVAMVTTPRPSSEVSVAGAHVLLLSSDGIRSYRLGSDGSLTQEFFAEATADQLAAGSGFFVTASGKELTLWDTSSGVAVSRGFVELDGNANDLAVDGTRIWVAEGTRGLAIYELGNGRLTANGHVAVGGIALAVSGKRLLVSGGDSLAVLDTSVTPARIVARGTSGTADFKEVHPLDDSTFLARNAVGAITVATLSADGSIAMHDVPMPVETFATSGRRLLVSGDSLDRVGLPVATESALRLYDATDPRALHLDGQFGGQGGELTGVAIKGQTIYVSDSSTIHVIDASEPLAPREVGSMTLPEPFDLLHLDGNLLLAHGREYVYMLDVTDAAHPRLIGSYETFGLPFSGAVMAGPYLIEVNRASGLHVLDISDPANPVQLSGLKNGGVGMFNGVIAAVPGALYAGILQGVKVADISDPRHATLVEILDATDVTAAATIPATGTAPPLLLLADAGELRVFDISAPTLPREVGDLAVGPAVSIAARENVAWIALSTGEITRIDLSDPSHPMVAGNLTGLSDPSQIAVAGPLLATADRFSLRIASTLAGVTSSLDAVTTPYVKPDSGPRLIHVGWSPATVPLYQIESASDAAFSSPSLRETTRTEAWVHDEGDTWVRVRATDGCTAGPWSPALHVAADPSPVEFVTSGISLLALPGSSVTIPIALHNRTAGNATAELTTDDASLTIPTQQTLAGGETAVVEGRMTLSGSGRQDAQVRIRGSEGQPFRITVYTPRTAAQSTTTAAPSLVIPGVIASRGAKGTDWRSELSLGCRTDCSMTLKFVPNGDPAAARSVELSFDAGTATVTDDVVRNLFGVDQGTGFLAIDSGNPEAVLASVRTYNHAAEGDFGQRIPAVRIDGEVSPTRLALGVAANDSFRTNIGYVNPAGSTQTVHLTLVDPAGGDVSTVPVTLEPFGAGQTSTTSLFGSDDAVEGASIRVDGGSGIIVYVSRIDALTGDAVFSYARNVSEETSALPRLSGALAIVGSTPGAEGTDWKTSLQMTNPTSAPVTAHVTFVPADDASAAMSADLDLQPHAGWFSSDFLASLFPRRIVATARTGALRIESTAVLPIWARLYNDGGSSGTYGEYVQSFGSPSRRVSIAALGSPSPSALQIFPLVQNDARRTNIGLAEFGGEDTDVEVTIRDSRGAVVAVIDQHLAPYQSVNLLSPLSSAGVALAGPLRAEITAEPSGASIIAYASVVENATGDAVFVPAE
ncbi:MAG: hypothetical protein WBX15_18825 [Thermoanaerobaculia bacterium]